MGSIFLKKQFKIEAKNKTAINLKAVKIKSYGAFVVVICEKTLQYSVL